MAGVLLGHVPGRRRKGAGDADVRAQGGSERRGEGKDVGRLLGRLRARWAKLSGPKREGRRVAPNREREGFFFNSFLLFPNHFQIHFKITLKYF
jgi:hypothetical protein